MRAAGQIPDDDVGRYLGFFGPIPWLLYGLYLVTVTYFALVLGGPSARTGWGVASLFAVAGTLLLIVLPTVTPLPWWRTAVILGVIIFTTAAITWQLPVHVHDLGYQTWEYNSNDLLMFCLAIRARIVAAWIGQFAMQCIVAVWSILETGSPAHGLLTSYTQAFPLVACSVFAFGLHHTARQIVRHRAAVRARAERELREEAEDRAIESELRLIRDMATPMLERIAAGLTIREGAVPALEAGLRDRIRSPRLAVEPLVTALRRARESGADVLVLDDLGERDLMPSQRRVVADSAAAEINRSPGRSFTLRVAWQNGRPMATLSADGRAVTSCVL